MFGMVVMFGLFHGLIFLPVLLSLIGPSSPPLSSISKPESHSSIQENQEANKLRRSNSDNHSSVASGAAGTAFEDPQQQHLNKATESYGMASGSGLGSNVVSPAHSIHQLQA